MNRKWWQASHVFEIRYAEQYWVLVLADRVALTIPGRCSLRRQDAEHTGRVETGSLLTRCHAADCLSPPGPEAHVTIVTDGTFTWSFHPIHGTGGNDGVAAGPFAQVQRDAIGFGHRVPGVGVRITPCFCPCNTRPLGLAAGLVVAWVVVASLHDATLYHGHRGANEGGGIGRGCHDASFALTSRAFLAPEPAAHCKATTAARAAAAAADHAPVSSAAVPTDRGVADRADVPDIADAAVTGRDARASILSPGAQSTSAIQVTGGGWAGGQAGNGVTVSMLWCVAMVMVSGPCQCHR